MCLRISSHTGISIAKKDIVCCKVVKADKTRFIFWKYWIAYFRKTRHRYNKVLVACNHLRPCIQWINNCSLVINKGFHALQTLEPLKEEYDDCRYAIIPKGAEYCFGNEGDIVANRIIVFENEKQREKYLQK